MNALKIGSGVDYCKHGNVPGFIKVCNFLTSQATDTSEEWLSSVKFVTTYLEEVS
jgi:hypothetical protein